MVFDLSLFTRFDSYFGSSNNYSTLDPGALINWKNIEPGTEYYDIQRLEWFAEANLTVGLEVSTLRTLALTGNPEAILAAAVGFLTDSDIVMGNDVTFNVDVNAGELQVDLVGAGSYTTSSLFGFSSTSRVELLPDSNTLSVGNSMRIPVWSDNLGQFEHVGEDYYYVSPKFKFQNGGSSGTITYLGNGQFRFDIRQPVGILNTVAKVHVVTIPQLAPVLDTFDPTLGKLESSRVSIDGEVTFTYKKQIGFDESTAQYTSITYKDKELVGVDQKKVFTYGGKEVSTVVDKLKWEDGYMISAEHRVFSPSGSEETITAFRRKLDDKIIEEIWVQKRGEDGLHTTYYTVESEGEGDNREITRYLIREGDGEEREVSEEEFIESIDGANRKIRVYCFAAGTPIDMADGSQKPIEQVEVGDLVLAYDPEREDGLGELAPRRVTRTYATPDKLLLDFHGLQVTPGHVFLCGDGPHKGRHRMLIDILREDGAVVAADGRVLRAATNAPLGSREDAFLRVRYLPAGAESVHQEGRLRAGTLLLTDEGETASVLQLLEAEGYTVTDDGLVARDGEEPHALHWYGPLPRPEDYVLQVSNLTDADLAGDPDYIPEVASEGGPILGAGWSPARHDDAVPSLFVSDGAPKHGGETLH